MVLQPHGCIATIVVWALPRSLATTRGIIVYFLFLEVLRCFSSLRLLSTLWQSGSLTAVGLSHSDICGSKIICIYPQLFAAYHVLHRLQEPRHPPYALHYLLTAVDYDVDGSACSHEEGIHHAIFILYFFCLVLLGQ